jgi:hypothetical protein
LQYLSLKASLQCSRNSIFQLMRTEFQNFPATLNQILTKRNRNLGQANSFFVDKPSWDRDCESLAPISCCKVPKVSKKRPQGILAKGEDQTNSTSVYHRSLIQNNEGTQLRDVEGDINTATTANTQTASTSPFLSIPAFSHSLHPLFLACLRHNSVVRGQGRGAATGQVWAATLLQPRLPHGLHCTAVQFLSGCAMFCCMTVPASLPSLDWARVGC